MLFNPPADIVVAAGDLLIVMGAPQTLRILENMMAVVAG